MKNSLIALMMLLLVFGGCKKKTQNGLDDVAEKKITNLISQMTLEEKLSLLGGSDMFNVKGIERLGIPDVHMADGPCGIRIFGPSTAYVSPIGISASWDTSLINNCGKILALDAQSKDVQIILGPGMNIYRAPQCGRNFEYLGEDPFLSGKMASSFIQGIQSQGVIAVAKHLVCNNQEYDRHKVSSDVDERTLQEIYFPAFKTCVQEANVACVMTSYNLLNGIHTSENGYLVNEVLKKDWGFNGLVMSDWWSCYSTVGLANNGPDLEMPAAKFMSKDSMLLAIKNGKVTEEVVNDKVRKLLRIYFRYNLIGEKKNNPIKFNEEEADKAVIESARGGIVLLKNENILPLDASKIKKIVVIGPYSKAANTCGGGCAYTMPLRKPVSFYDAIKKEAGSNIDVQYAFGAMINLPLDFFEDSLFEGKGLKTDFFNNINLDGTPVFSRYDRNINFNFEKPVGNGIGKNMFSVRFTGKFKSQQKGMYRIAVSADDGYRLWIDNKLMFNEWKDQAEKPLMKDIAMLAGKEHSIKLEYYQAAGGGALRMGIRMLPTDPIGEAVELAKKSDVAVVCVGFDKSNELEDYDRPFGLTKETIDFVNSIKSVNKNTIVLLNAGGNAGIADWIGNIPAVLHCWYLGQSGTIALAEILFGKTNPSGKLPFTIEKRWEDNPVFNNYFDTDSDKRVAYKEGIFVGYRGYEKNNIEPLFPFGFGLSYTTFEYSNIKTSAESMGVNDELEINVDVKNIGKRDGKEIVQLYINDVKSSLPRPNKELKGFVKVDLKVGETKTVTFKIKKEALSYFNPEKHQWVAEAGEFKVLIGSSSKDIRLEKSFVLK